ncbi:MAG: phosphatidate cytidylyltransferase [Dehalococcoidia bacterium]|nr:phosphatidate cytidylyltransferase [Dehalococcoidia bacterium]
MLRQRVLSSIVLIPILIAAIWFGDPWFTLIVAVFGILGAVEFYRMAKAVDGEPASALGFLLVLAFIIGAHSDDGRLPPLLVTTAVLLPLIWFIRTPDRSKAFLSWAWTITGAFYIGWTMSHFVLLRELDDGRDWVFLALLGTFTSDTVAFFVGRSFGKHKMAPSISPGKTWEGAIGGVAGAIAAVIVLGMITGLDEIGYVKLIPLGLLLSLFAQVGDLSESVLKRSSGIKDAGSLIPGHGGVLDRLDSIIFSVVLVYYYILWIV